MGDLLSDAFKLFSGCVLYGVGFAVIAVGIMVFFLGSPAPGLLIGLVGLFILCVGVVLGGRSRRSGRR